MTDETLHLPKRGRSANVNQESESETKIHGLSGKTVTIQIPSSENNTKSVCGSINGIQFNIPRGKPVEVPVEVVGVLNDANVLTLSEDGRSVGYSNRFNAQVLAA